MVKRRQRKRDEDRSSLEVVEESDDDKQNRTSTPKNRNKKSRHSEQRQPESAESEDNLESSAQVQFSQQEPDYNAPLVNDDGTTTARNTNGGRKKRKKISMKNVSELDDTLREKIVTEISRALLFKSLTMEPIDRLPLLKKIMEDFSSSNTSGEKKSLYPGLWELSCERLRAIFGFEVRDVPEYMTSAADVAKKYANLNYAVNIATSSSETNENKEGVNSDPAGSHSKKIHSVHESGAIGRGLLMLILAFTYCKGELRSGGSTRWLAEKMLYKLLHSIDGNIPAEPPSREGASSSSRGQNSNRESGVFSPGVKVRDGISLTPDIDSLLETFVTRDYILRRKAEPLAMDDGGGSAGGSRGNGEFAYEYAMGPRSCLEVGRKQVIYFCAEVLGEEPDSTMLAEFKEEDERKSEN